MGEKKREKFTSEIVSFAVDEQLRKDLDSMKRAAGCASVGEFMRFLLRQERKTWRVVGK